jgi:hypothetical protein
VIDRNSGLSVAAFADKVNTIVGRLHAQGTLSRLSMKYFHTDFAGRAK